MHNDGIFRTLVVDSAHVEPTILYHANKQGPCALSFVHDTYGVAADLQLYRMELGFLELTHNLQLIRTPYWMEADEFADQEIRPPDRNQRRFADHRKRRLFI